MKHNAADLKQMQSLSLDLKIEMTKRRIKEWYEAFGGQVYVSFSGGKDSTALLDIVRSLYQDVPAVFCDTGLEYPEIKEFVRQQKDCLIVRPSISFRDVIKTYGYPVIGKESARYIYYARRAKALHDDKLYDRYVNGVRGGYKFMELSSVAKSLIDSRFLVSDKCCDVMKKIR